MTTLMCDRLRGQQLDYAQLKKDECLIRAGPQLQSHIFRPVRPGEYLQPGAP